jgi:hypothetical protein
MRTEITIPFSFDTAPIEQMLQEVSKDEVTRKVDEIVKEGVLSALPEAYSSGWGGTGKPDWNTYVRNRTDAFIAKNADTIIDRASVLLAMRGATKRPWKDVLAEYKEEMADE